MVETGDAVWTLHRIPGDTPGYYTVATHCDGFHQVSCLESCALDIAQVSAACEEEPIKV